MKPTFATQELTTKWEQAEAHEKSGNYNDAYEAYTEILSSLLAIDKGHPTIPQIEFYMLKNLIRQNKVNVSQAKVYYNNLLAKIPANSADKAEVHNSYAKFLKKSKSASLEDMEEVLVQFNLSYAIYNKLKLESVHECIDLLMQTGDICYEKQDFTQSLNAYTKALLIFEKEFTNIHLKYVAISNRITKIYLLQKNYYEATQNINKVLEIVPYITSLPDDDKQKIIQNSKNLIEQMKAYKADPALKGLIVNILELAIAGPANDHNEHEEKDPKKIRFSKQ